MFKPDRERDELSGIIGTDEHAGRTRGKGNILWKFSFPEDIGMYRTQKRKREMEAEHIRTLQQYDVESRQLMLATQKQKEELQVIMQEEIKRQVQTQLSSVGFTNTSALGTQSHQVKSSCASMQ